MDHTQVQKLKDGRCREMAVSVSGGSTVVTACLLGASCKQFDLGVVCGLPVFSALFFSVFPNLNRVCHYLCLRKKLF